MILDPLERSYAEAETLTATWAKSFHFASRFLPAAKRRAVCALYAYCRHADNLVDDRGDRPAAEVRAELAALAGEVRAMHAGTPPADDRWLALHDTLQRHPVPLAPLLELLEGVALDLEPVAMPDFPALERYCRQVAGGVGLLVAPILGARPGEEAAGLQLGLAMQLTNILRDVREDLDRGRVYFPATELATWGITRADLERRQMTPRLRLYIAFQVCRAREYFEAAEPAIDRFPDDGSRLTVRLMQRTYAGILDEIERMDCDVFRTRAHVPFRRKLVILGRAMLARGPRQSLLDGTPA
ncbi:MAG: phytoene/squalene synthase family protein [Gemmatimonadales bacterium]